MCWTRTVTPLAAICLLNSSATMAPLPYLEACRYSIFMVTPCLAVLAGVCGLSGSRRDRPADAPTRDAGRNHAHKELLSAPSPRLDARQHDRCTLSLGVHRVRGSLDEDAPSLPGRRAEFVDFERHLGLGVLDPGAEILPERAVRLGPEHDRPLMDRIVDRQHRRPETAGEPDPANAARRDQPQALLLVQRLNNRFRSMALACHIALLCP